MGILLNKARAAIDTDGTLGVGDIGRIISKSLEDGKISPSEKKDLETIREEFSNNLTPKAEKALKNFLSLGSSFDPNLSGKIFNVDAALAEELELHDINTPAELLVKTMTPKDRQTLAGNLSIDNVMLTSLAEHADLARATGVGKIYAAVLHKIDINNIQELATQNPTELRRKVLDFLKTDAGKEITSRRPSLNSVTRWINNACSLPTVLRYVDQTFSKSDFSQLSQHEQAQVLWGCNDDWNSIITMSNPQRLPRSIRNVIEACEQTPNEHLLHEDFTHVEWAEMQGIERIRSGDETIGYRITFAFKADSVMDSEGMNLPDGYHMDSEGAVVDSEGAVIDPSDIEYDGMSVEGNAIIVADFNGKILDNDWEAFD